MKILFIGGTGNLSMECSRLALQNGIELYHLNRGRSLADALAAESDREEFGPVISLTADIHDEAAVRRAVEGRHFDVVVDFIAFTPADIDLRLRCLAARCNQYVFISSASVYRKPADGRPITERTPLANPYWPYAQAKIASEGRLWAARRRGEGPPVTIVRPSHTYGRGWLPSPFGSADFAVAARLLAGKPVIVPGDGQSLWTLTHSRDFAYGLVGLLGKPAALDQAVQIVGDECYTWDKIHHCLAAALGVSARLVHIPSDFIARVDPDFGASLLGDKANSSRFDCSKLQSMVPGFKARVRLQDGLSESVAWRLADPERQQSRSRIPERLDRILEVWQQAMGAAFPD